MSDDDVVTARIREIQRRLDALEQERLGLAAELEGLRRRPATTARLSTSSAPVTMASPTTAKIALFRSLFQGRDDVFPRRWENPKTGKAGYSPACRNEWIRRLCGKPKVKCGDCPHRAFLPVSDEIIRDHLQGRDGRTGAIICPPSVSRRLPVPPRRAMCSACRRR